jgi:RNA-directed DNA polymerase
MTKTPINLQDLRRRIYVKAKAEPSWRFWGLYVHVCKMETLREAYKLAKANDGSPGVDGVTFEAIETGGLEQFLVQIQCELASRSYRPMRLRRVGIPKEGGKVRWLSIPAIRDRVVQGAVKLIIEPIFEADFQPGSFGYRPKRSTHDAVRQVNLAIADGKTLVYDLDLRAYFDNVRHHLLLEKVAKRVQDDELMALLKQILKASGKKGVPQGGVISPLLSNIYLNEVDQLLEQWQEKSRWGRTYVAYVRFADDLVILVKSPSQSTHLLDRICKDLHAAFDRLQVEVNMEKTRVVDLTTGGCFPFLGFDFRRVRALAGQWRPDFTPRMKKRTAFLAEISEIFRRHRSQPVGQVIAKVNPKLRGWVNYFAIGYSSRCFSYVRQWMERKVRYHMMRAKQCPGFGWKRWSKAWLYSGLGLFDAYKVRPDLRWKAAPT